MAEVRTVLPQPANPCSHKCRLDPDFHLLKAALLINHFPVPPWRFSFAALKFVDGSGGESHLPSLSRWLFDFRVSTPAFALLVIEWISCIFVSTISPSIKV